MKIVNETGLGQDTKVLDDSGKDITKDLGVCSIDIEITSDSYVQATLKCEVKALNVDVLDAMVDIDATPAAGIVHGIELQKGDCLYLDPDNSGRLVRGLPTGVCSAHGERQCCLDFDRCHMASFSGRKTVRCFKRRHGFAPQVTGSPSRPIDIVISTPVPPGSLDFSAVESRLMEQIKGGFMLHDSKDDAFKFADEHISPKIPLKWYERDVWADFKEAFPLLFIKRVKALPITDDDVDIYGDWLRGSAAVKFICGDYTHVVCDGEINEAAVYKGMVCVGEGWPLEETNLWPYDDEPVWPRS